MPFLEIITRTCKRPELLARNQASIRQQTDGDYLHTIFAPGLANGAHGPDVPGRLAAA